MKRHKATMFLRLVAVLTVAVTGGKLAHAQGCNIEWTGNAGTDVWGTAGNWSTHQVPGRTSNVCILKAPSTGSVDATTTPSISVDSIQVGPGVGLAFGAGTVSIATSLTSQGYLTLFGTTLTAPSVNMESGSLVGGGTIEGSLINSGYLHPTNAETLTVTNYTQTANGELSVQWGTTGLAVNSSAALSGSLVVGINPKRPPKKGSTYTAMTFGSLSGEFKTVTVEEGGTVEYTGNSVVVTFQ
jgi:hypothetical protein